MTPEPAIPRSETEVVIVGAGAAGIAAAHTLAAARCEFVVLEARPRVGGRGWTVLDRAPFPLDLGCGWLHSADRNPWSRIAEAAGFRIDRTPAPWTTAERDRSLSAEEYADYRRAMDRFYGALEAASETSPDRPAADFLEPGCRWNALLHTISTYANGVELDRVSVQEFNRYSDTEVNWRIVEGYGALIAAHAKGLPIVLDCPVERIDQAGKRLCVVTPRGTIEARAAIVTVPTAVLATEAIRFTPELTDKLQAASVLPMGLADKVMLALDQPESLPAESRLFGRIDQVGAGSYHVRPFGRPMIEGYFGGQLARELEREGERGFAAFAVDELVERLGSAVRARLRPLAVSTWGQDPFALGAYSHALPGHANARAALASPAERLFFAGEACSLHSFSTAHGAYESGVAAANQAIAALVPDHVLDPR